MGIFAKKYPDRVQDLISYFSLISKAVEYDKIFRVKILITHLYVGVLLSLPCRLYIC